MDGELTARVRDVLQQFQDGYTARDLDRLDEFMELFAGADGLEVIGTGAYVEGKGEWCLEPEAVRRLVEGDWRFWGDLELDVAGARIHVLGDVAWLATAGTVTERVEADEGSENYLAYVQHLLDLDVTAREKMLEIVRDGANAIVEMQRGETYIWPLRFTAVLVRRDGRWRFHQMQFSFPTTRAPDVRILEEED
jgi:hypothetical protein